MILRLLFSKERISKCKQNHIIRGKTVRKLRPHLTQDSSITSCVYKSCDHCFNKNFHLFSPVLFFSSCFFFFLFLSNHVRSFCNKHFILDTMVKNKGKVFYIIFFCSFFKNFYNFLQFFCFFSMILTSFFFCREARYVLITRYLNCRNAETNIMISEPPQRKERERWLQA